METEPLFPFGFGLSYTTFQYGKLNLSSPQITSTGNSIVSTTLTNAGRYAGEEVVQLYISDISATVQVPQYALKGFQRVHLEPGESKTVTFEIQPSMLELVDEDGVRKIEPGEFRVSIGGSVPSSRSIALGAPQHQQVTLRVR